MAVGYAVSALNRPGWIRKAQQVFTARFALAARRPVRRLPPSPGWTWRCALRKANGRKSLREYPWRSGVYAAPNGSATALPKLVLYFDDKAQAIQYWEQQKEQASANTEEHVEAVPPTGTKRKFDVLAPIIIGIAAAIITASSTIYHRCHH